MNSYSPPSEKSASRSAQRMRICFGLLVVAVVALVVALIAVVVVKNNEIDDLNHEIDDLNNEMDHLKMNKSSRATSWPCPPKTGGLMTEGEPATPEPFHDITVEELERLYDYLLTVTELNLKPPSQTSVNTASIFMVDLHLPPKADVLRYLDGSGARPPREAKVMVFRGDLSPPVVEEYRVGPLSKPNYIHLMNSGTHRNPVEFAVRPIGNVEFISMFESFVPVVDNEIREVLLESYGGTLTNCGDNCLKAIFITASTGVLNEKRRKYWAVLTHPAEYYHVYPLDIAILLDVTGSNTSQWRVDKIWYAGAYYNSTSELVTRYKDTQQPINKTRVPFVRTSPDLPSTQNLRGDAVPDPPQRPPVQVEPDGKRYTIHHRHVRYLHWDFDFRMSSFHGPQLYDVKFQGERIAYEVGLSELAVFYSSNDPAMRYMDFVDGGVLIGTHSKTLAPGTDCPESATYVPTSFLGEAMNKPVTFGRGFCVFEHNNGIPLRRHASYSWVEGAYYAGMADSVLVVRSILTIVNYDYVVDFVFHQNGVLEVRAASTGSIIGSFYRPDSAPYGFHIDENLLGNVHQHVFHFKADLDILGTANRYETLDITAEEVDKDPMGPNVAAGEKYSQIRFDKKLYNTEMEALYRYNFDQPKYHIVHNNQNTTKYGVPRAYRLHMGGMSKQLLAENQDNERTASWARHQMAVTVRKDEEEFSSSAYAMFDSIDPVVNFADFYSDNESIVDQDLVFWVAMGVHHIPHTEDLPVTPTAGGHLAFFLMPNNYFSECPSVSSRDGVRLDFVPDVGLRVTTNGNEAEQFCGAPTFQELVNAKPETIDYERPPPPFWPQNVPCGTTDPSGRPWAGTIGRLMTIKNLELVRSAALAARKETNQLVEPHAARNRNSGHTAPLPGVNHRDSVADAESSGSMLKEIWNEGRTSTPHRRFFFCIGNVQS